MNSSTLSNDQLSDKRFDFQFVNPPYGDEWSNDYDAVTTRRDLHSLGENIHSHLLQAS